MAIGYRLSAVSYQLWVIGFRLVTTEERTETNADDQEPVTDSQ
jgi:hypothetical protein